MTVHGIQQHSQGMPQDSQSMHLVLPGAMPTGFTIHETDSAGLTELTGDARVFA